MLSKEKSKYIRSLKDKKTREELGEFLVEWGKSVKELLESRGGYISPENIKELYVSDKFIWENASLLSSVSYEIGSSEEISKASSLTSNDDAIAIIKIPNLPEYKPQAGNWTLVLDNISDPGNLGTILRIADWYGISEILCTKNTVDVFNPKTIIASMGSYTRVKVFYEDIEQYLKQDTLRVYGTFLEGENIHSNPPTQPGYIIIGSESHGISAEIEKLVSEKITIPRIGQAESLNAWVATAIILDNVFRNI